MSELSSHGKARFAIEFDNRVRLSFIWGSMTYSDNHDENWLPKSILSQRMVELGAKPEPEQIVSHTVEIMAFGPEEFVNWFADKYDNPASYVPVNDIPRLLQRAKSFKTDTEVTDLPTTDPEATPKAGGGAK